MAVDRSVMKFYPHKFKLILTASCLFIFLNIGIITVLPVTTLLDLAFLLDSTYSKVSVALTFYSVSALIGSLTGGLLFKVVDRRICLVVLMTIFSSVCMSFPFLKSVPVFIVIMVVKGLSIGAMDVALNSWILDLWGQGCNTYMQALHFTFGLGIAIAPMIATPFMGLEPAKANSTESPVSSTASPVSSTEMSINEAIRTDKPTAKPVEHFQLVFVVACIVGIISAVIQLVLIFVENSRIKNLKVEDEQTDEAEDNRLIKSDDSEQMASSTKKLALILGGIVITFYVGMEINSFRFVTAYVHFQGYDVPTSGEAAIYLNTSYAIARFIGIFVSRFMSTDLMAIIHLFMITTGALILAFLAKVSLTWITVALIFIGSGCSVIFASVYSMLEERTHLSNVVVGVLTAFGTLPSTIYPSVMPPILEKYPMAYVYNILVSMVIVFIGVIVIILKVPKRAKT